MTLTEMLLCTAWLTGIFIYWWALAMIFSVCVAKYLGDRFLEKMDRKVVPLKTSGVY